MHEDSPEISYYRRVEDLFSALRGAPHVLSPRDFQLLRSWWRDEIPLAAVAAGLTEVFARNRDRGDSDPVVSLSYCRHAVKRHAKRLAEMHIGDGSRDADPSTIREGVQRLASTLGSAANDLAEARPSVAGVLTRITEQIELAGDELPTDQLDEHLYGLESTMLHECWNALNETERMEINRRIDPLVASSQASDEARERSLRALRDRELRLMLGLPRLELDE